jgi:hypothetical protein
MVPHASNVVLCVLFGILVVASGWLLGSPKTWLKTIFRPRFDQSKLPPRGLRILRAQAGFFAFLGLAVIATLNVFPL